MGLVTGGRVVEKLSGMETPVGTKTFPVHKRNNRSSKLFQSSKVFFQDGVANSVISTSLIRGYQPRHLG